MNHCVASALVIVGVVAPFGRRHHDVDAGLEVADRLVDREGGGDVGVERLLDRELALPHLTPRSSARRSTS